MTHIMLDLETMSLRPYAAIVSIGAVQMSDTGDALDQFSRNVDLASSTRAGLHMDPNTVMFWLRQNKDAQRSLMVPPPMPLQQALTEFGAWVQEKSTQTRQAPRMWGNGAAADNVWMGSAYDHLGMPRPWSYKHDRCYRTFRVMHSEVAEPPPNPVQHSAIHDAVWQAKMLREICIAKLMRLP